MSPIYNSFLIEFVAKIGHRHPDPVVETASLSSVEPPDVWYRLSIPESTIDYGNLSALQLETIVYTCQKHDTFLANGERAGFLVGRYNKLFLLLTHYISYCACSHCPQSGCIYISVPCIQFSSDHLFFSLIEIHSSTFQVNYVVSSGDACKGHSTRTKGIFYIM